MLNLSHFNQGGFQLPEFRGPLKSTHLKVAEQEFDGAPMPAETQKSISTPNHLYDCTEPAGVSNVLHPNWPSADPPPVTLSGVLSPNFTAFPFGTVFVFGYARLAGSARKRNSSNYKEAFLARSN